MSDERVTVTLPRDMVDDIDRRERNRSKFIRRAVRLELDRLRHEALLRSLENPHVESQETEALGITEWGAGLPERDDDLLDAGTGVEVEWRPGDGWAEVER